MYTRGLGGIYPCYTCGLGGYTPVTPVGMKGITLYMHPWVGGV